jgi:indole-3-glycerol phosphate synthase
VVWLDRLVEATRERLDEGYYNRVPTALMNDDPPSLAEALADPPGVVAEVKLARPDGTSWDAVPDQQALAYAAGGADGISVLTDRDYFDGDLAHLQSARAAGRPLLMKDVLVHGQQAQAARAWGASAVLVIARLPREGYTDRGLDELVDAVHRADLEALVEVVTREELDAALDAGADVVGVNQRDLDTLEHDPDRTRRLLSGRDLDVPALHLSGIETPEDVRRALDDGADGVLVGSAAMDAGDPAALVRSLEEAAP